LAYVRDIRIFVFRLLQGATAPLNGEQDSRPGPQLGQDNRPDPEQGRAMNGRPNIGMPEKNRDEAR